MIGIKSLARKSWNSWSGFWFDADYNDPMKLFRVVIGLLLFCFYTVRSPDLLFFYSDTGLVPYSVFPELMDMHHRYTLFQIFHSSHAIWIMQFSLLTSLLLLTFGVLPNLMALSSFVLQLSFMRRNVSLTYGADLISMFFLFYFCFADFRTGPRRSDWRSAIGSAVFRFCQLQICIIYFYSGIEKVKGPSWWNGTALWYVLGNPQISRGDLSWMAHFPMVIYVSSLLTVAWETYFPILVWSRRARYPMLALGVMLHLGIATLTLLPFFGVIMIATYALFLDPPHAAFMLRVLQKPFYLKNFRRFGRAD